MWPGAVLRTILQVALDKDASENTSVISSIETPSKALAKSLAITTLRDQDNSDDEDIFKLIKIIHSERRHATTDHMLEYRLEIDPRELVARARSGIEGTRQEMGDSASAGIFASEEDDEDEEEDGKRRGGVKKSPPEPDSTLRIWMPAVMVEHAYPELVASYRRRKEAKDAKKAKRSTPKKARKKAVAEEPLKEVTKTETKPSKPSKVNGVENGDDIFKAPKKPNTESGSEPKTMKSVLELLDEDLFAVSAITPRKPKNDPFNSPGSSTSSSNARLVPRSLLIDKGYPVQSLIAPFPCIRQRTSSLSSSDEGVVSHLRKSPRKSREQKYKRPPRSPSPSPLRPTLRSGMRPLEMAAARKANPPPEDHIIVISSDSDEGATKQAKRGSAMHYDSDIIDLT